MKALSVLFLLSGFLLLGCNKPDPNPELRDPIYLDIQKELADTQKAIEAEKANLAEHKKNLGLVVPQSGQIKYAQKRYYDSEAVINKLKQQLTYWQIHLETRKKVAREDYFSAYKLDKHWPDPKEYQEYLQIKRLEKIPKTWSVKNRMNELNIHMPKKPGSGSKSDEHGGKTEDTHKEKSEEHH